jgi:ABC-type spermidine/putrescine transport system permease subunit I
MKDIVIGMSKPGIAIAAALTFSLSFGDSISSEILVGNNIQLVGNMEKFSFGHAQEWGVGSAESILTVLLLLAVIIPVLRKIDIQRLITGSGQ